MPQLILLLLLLLPISTFAAPPRLLFDQGHQQAFVIEKDGPLHLSRLAELFSQQGWQVASETGELTTAVLAQTDALIISGPFHPLQQAEIAALLGYLQNGGKLAVMIHIGQPLLPLLHQLGIDVANRVIHENPPQQGAKSSDFVVTNFKPHPLTRDLEQFSIYGGWPLAVFAQQGEALATTSQHSWVDLNQDQQLNKGDLISPFDVIIAGAYGPGSVVVFADDAIFQNQFLHNGNIKLAENLARWLKHKPAQATEI